MLQILIIDDDKNIRRYLKTILLAAGYTPICTETAELMTKTYDAI